MGRRTGGDGRAAGGILQLLRRRLANRGPVRIHRDRDHGDTTTTTTSAAADPGADIPINHLQVIGSHNSYHLAAQTEIEQVLSALAPSYWEELDYSHLPLTDQLESYGIRQFEIDVFADPEGGLFADRPALALVDLPTPSGIPELDDPGFKVLHIQDIDFASTCWTFVVCLSEIEAWSSANPTHVPIMIMIENKSGTIAEGASGLGIDVSEIPVEFTVPLDMTPELFADLEAEVLSVFDRDRIISPDDVRGDNETLHEAVGTDGWPTLGESRGKVLFALVDTGEAGDLYKADAPALEGKLFFTSATPGEPDAAFVRVDDPVGDAEALADALAAGYLVRTRSDTPTVHARTGDTSRRDAALASGAQYVSTDFYAEREEFGTGFAVELPGGATVRCSPTVADEGCADADLSE